MVGFDRIEARILQREELAAKMEELRTGMDQGGTLEAAVRAHMYILMGQRAVDARSFEVLRHILKAHPEVTLSRYKAVVRQQWGMLAIDQKAALKALPGLLPEGADERRRLFDGLKAVITVAGGLDEEARHRFNEIEGIFELDATPARAQQGVRTKALH